MPRLVPLSDVRTRQCAKCRLTLRPRARQLQRVLCRMVAEPDLAQANAAEHRAPPQIDSVSSTRYTMLRANDQSRVPRAAPFNVHSYNPARFTRDPDATEDRNLRDVAEAATQPHACRVYRRPPEVLCAAVAVRGD